MSRLDAVFAAFGDNFVCLGDGTGEFPSCAPVGDGDSFSMGVALGLLDADSHLDAVFANSLGRSEACLGDGTGGFAFCTDVNFGLTDHEGVALGFLDGDSNLDVVLAADGPGSVACLGDGMGGFLPCTPIGSFNGQGVALGLIDGDANLDAIFAVSIFSNQVCFGDGLGGFSSCVPVSADSNDTRDVALGLLNADPHLDAVFANNSGTSDGFNMICLGDGSGGFTCEDMSADPADQRESNAVALGLVNGDSNLDAVFANALKSQPDTVCLGDGAGGFASCQPIHDLIQQSQGVALGFVNGDSYIDVLLAGLHTFVCLGDGLGAFSPCTEVLPGLTSQAVALGELGPELFVDGFESGDTSAWSATVP